MQKENKMGTMPVTKLVFNMSLPMMASMLVQALYNIVDSIFVAKICENALTAVSFAYPIQMLMISVAAGTGVGINALLSRSLGERNYEKANKTATNGIFLFFLSVILFMILGLTIVKPFYLSQAGNADPQIIEYGVQYLTIVMIGCFGIMGQILFEKLLVSTGHTLGGMATLIVGAVVNLILDPIMIFGYFGCPKMGVAGAAIATVIGQICAAITGIVLNFTRNTEIKITLKGFKPEKEIIAGIYKVGFPAIIMQAIGSVMTYLMNLVLIEFTSTATAVFGIYFKLQSFFFMPVIGLTNGVSPIMAYNYGAKNKERLVKTIKVSLIMALCLMATATIIFETVPDKLLLLFSASEDMLGIGVPALRIIASHFMIAWACIVLSAVFQSLGNGVYSLIVSAMRQLLALVPSAYILAKVAGLEAVWFSFPIAEVVSGTVSVLLFIRIYRKMIKNL